MPPNSVSQVTTAAQDVASRRGRPPMPDRRGGQRRRWSSGRRRQPNDHLRRPGGIRNFKGHRERRLSHEIEAVTAVYWGHFRRQMTVVEIIIAELHCLSNGAHRVGCSASYVRDGRGCTK